MKVYDDKFAKLIREKRKILGKYYYLIAIFLLLIGVTFRFLHTVFHKEGVVWEILGEFGTFLALIVSLHLVYEILVKKEEQAIFINELEIALSKFFEKMGQVEKIGIENVYTKLPKDTLSKQIEEAKSVKILQTWTG